MDVNRGRGSRELPVDVKRGRGSGELPVDVKKKTSKIVVLC